MTGNWNALADTAKGEFIVIIGDDDRLLPEFVSKAIVAILPDGAVAFSNHLLSITKGHGLMSRVNGSPKNMAETIFGLAG